MLVVSEFNLITEDLVYTIAGLRCRDSTVLAEICDFWTYVYNYDAKLFDLYDPWHYNVLVETAFDDVSMPSVMNFISFCDQLKIG